MGEATCDSTPGEIGSALEGCGRASPSADSAVTDDDDTQANPIVPATTLEQGLERQPFPCRHCGQCMWVCATPSRGYSVNGLTPRALASKTQTELFRARAMPVPESDD